MAFRYIIILPILTYLLLSCQKRDWNNPFDPNCPKETFTPTNFKAEQQGNAVKLSWDQSNSLISGYTIERKIGNGEWVEMINLDKSDLAWNDSQITGGQIHQYRLTAVAGTNLSKQETTQITPVTAPLCSTNIVTVFTSNAANLGGNVTSDGGLTVIDRGVCYGISQNPMISGNKMTMGTGTGLFSNIVLSLSVSTTYYVRAYAINSKGITYGNQVSFKTDNVLTDAGNNTYKTVIIGDQVWMAENLKYLPEINTDNSNTINKYYVYNYFETNLTVAKSSSNYTTYGTLYNWPAAIKSCPSGWHLPTDVEWEKLAQYVSDQKGPYSKSSNNWNNVGKHLKSTGTINGGDGLWLNSGVSDIGTDDFGFSGLPGGKRGDDGKFNDRSGYGYWWSATEFSASNGRFRSLSYYHTIFGSASPTKDIGLSVRCVKD